MSIDGGGWTVLQRRVNGSVSFEHNWEEYKNGFGILEHELWLGNNKMHYITNRKNYELRMDMINLDEDAYFAKYSLFRIKDENFKFQLEIGTYDSASTASYDAMDYHRDQFFSTPDMDNDAHSGNCAANYRAGWWYKSCNHFDFNAYDFRSCSGYHHYWYNLPGSNCLMYTDIKIRPV
ncbi:Tenascin-R [Holothuria leucospilota]|uniref:Tenascin-R n=1 Tax=Holothuria leucospilota TaxID=206669 RepID=A0A9Q0YBL9_HOLLE|nr:Tenascin-R [Holothuria leucospilota]